MNWQLLILQYNINWQHNSRRTTTTSSRTNWTQHTDTNSLVRVIIDVIFFYFRNKRRKHTIAIEIRRKLFAGLSTTAWTWGNSITRPLDNDKDRRGWHRVGVVESLVESTSKKYPKKPRKSMKTLATAGIQIGLPTPVRSVRRTSET